MESVPRFDTILKFDRYAKSRRNQIDNPLLVEANDPRNSFEAFIEHGPQRLQHDPRFSTDDSCNRVTANRELT